jgi:hypothetical protein
MIALSFNMGSETRDIINLIKKVLEKKNAKPILNPLFGEMLSEMVIKDIAMATAMEDRMKLKSSYLERIRNRAIFNVKAARPKSKEIFFMLD